MVKKLKCTHFYKSFITKKLKDFHTKMCHIKPFKCTECEYACGTKTNLDHHMEIHFQGQEFKTNKES